MKKNAIQSNNDNIFYKKSREFLEIAFKMQTEDQGISIKDIMETLNVSKRTAVRVKDSIKDWFPKLQELHGPHNSKRWYLPKDSITFKTVMDSSPQKDVFQTKLENLFDLAKESGYNKLTDKQVMIAYYGKYTTQDKTDRKTLSEIREGLSKLQSPYKELIERND